MSDKLDSLNKLGYYIIDDKKDYYICINNNSIYKLLVKNIIVPNEYDFSFDIDETYIGNLCLGIYKWTGTFEYNKNGYWYLWSRCGDYSCGVKPWYMSSKYFGNKKVAKKIVTAIMNEL